MSAQELIQYAKLLLNDRKVEGVLGYIKGTTDQRRRPALIYSRDGLDQLVLDEHCEDCLAVYLKKHETIRPGQKTAIFVRPTGVRAMNVLVSEDQIDAGDYTLLPFEITKNGIQAGTPGHLHQVTSQLKEFNDPATGDPDIDEEMKRLEEMTAKERFDFWNEQFNKCIKCYACRQSCPMCYCEQCIVESNQPQWVATPANELGNFEWNVVRAFHLAGRCVECGNCQRACPVDIPLMLLNRKMASEAQKRFDYVAGSRDDQPAMLADFRDDDPEEFIK